jgi:hypothetical protein
VRDACVTVVYGIQGVDLFEGGDVLVPVDPEEVVDGALGPAHLRGDGASANALLPGRFTPRCSVAR